MTSVLERIISNYGSGLLPAIHRYESETSRSFRTNTHEKLRKMIRAERIRKGGRSGGNRKPPFWTIPSTTDLVPYPPPRGWGHRGRELMESALQRGLKCFRDPEDLAQYALHHPESIWLDLSSRSRNPSFRALPDSYPWPISEEGDSLDDEDDYFALHDEFDYSLSDAYDFGPPRLGESNRFELSSYPDGDSDTDDDLPSRFHNYDDRTTPRMLHHHDMAITPIMIP